MRQLCLYFPRLSTTLARRASADLIDRPLILVSGDTDQALVAGTSVEAAMMGVAVGMSATAARERCPAAELLPDNANACLDTLDQVASILRLRATPNVAVASREHVIVDLEGLETRFADEAAAAARLASLIHDATGLEVRAGVADTPEQATSTARCARRAPQVAPATGDRADRIAAYSSARQLSGRIAFTTAADSKEARAHLVRLLSRLHLLLEGRNESARRLRLVIERGERRECLALDAPAPLHSAADAIQLLAGYTGDERFTGATGLEVVLEKLGPSVRVERQPLPKSHATPAIMAPVRPVQHRLLRAG